MKSTSFKHFSQTFCFFMPDFKGLVNTPSTLCPGFSMATSLTHSAQSGTPQTLHLCSAGFFLHTPHSCSVIVYLQCCLLRPLSARCRYLQRLRFTVLPVLLHDRMVLLLEELLQILGIDGILLRGYL